MVVAALCLGACAPHQIYRPDTTVCTKPDPQRDCQNSALQDYRDPANPDAAYLLGFIEFDDQGQLWSRQQMLDVVNEVHRRAANSDLLMVAFVHGWKHSAQSDPEDGNITTFRDTLKRISEIESLFSRKVGKKPRQIVGIYLGWRGGSVTVPVLKELTFWDRKQTAQKVGHVGVTEALMRLEDVRLTKDAMINDCREDGLFAKSRTRLAVIGHSFGGAMVFSAVSQILQERFIDTLPSDICDARKLKEQRAAKTDARSFGNLVVLINPAFEANLFAPLSDMANERRFYFESQKPVLAILTSEADDATRIAFPIGRSLSTLFEKDRVVERRDPVSRNMVAIDQGTGNVEAVGHFLPYRTHTLKASAPAADVAGANPRDEIRSLIRVRDGWRRDAPGGTILFNGSTLRRTANSVGKNPYLVVQVGEELIPDHNQIDDPRIAAFIRELIFLTEG